MGRLAAAFLLLAAALFAAPEPPSETADAAFSRRDFRRALELFRAELRGGPDPEKERRVVACLAALQDWDEALREGEALVARSGDGLDGVKARRLLAGTLRDAPHWGFRSGGILRRGGEHREGEQVYVQHEDREAARAQLEAALEILYQAESGPRGAAPEWRAERVATSLDLADLLSEGYGIGAMPPVRAARTPERYFAPRQDWAAFLRADDLFRDARAVALEAGDTRSAALATYASALVRHRHRGSFEALEKAGRPLRSDEQEALRRSGDPAADLVSVAERFPMDPLADEALFSAARVHEERGLPERAEPVYERVAALFPKSPWASDAKAALQDLRRRELRFEMAGPALPGRETPVSVTTRNLERVSFSLRRLDPAAAFLDAAARRRGLWLDPSAAASGADLPEAAWAVTPAADAGRRHVSTASRLPALKAGLFLLAARGEGVEVKSLVLVTDLALVVKAGHAEALVYAADALSGAPVAGAEVVVREFVSWRDEPPRIQRGRSDAEGAFVAALGTGEGGGQIEAMARAGDRIAATPGTWRGHWGARSAGIRAHLTTDRPVYRPGHSVHFRLVALRGAEGGEAPARDARLLLIVRDPRGNELYRREHASDRFGVVSGSLPLGDEPPLGVYPFEVQAAGEGRVEVAGGQFRVEEYRKPDFEVSVDPGAALRAGETGRAEVVARYYFGSPVADASVSWSVFRTPPFRRPPFRDRHEWLFGPGYWMPSFHRPARQLVAQGEARTDAEGRARLEWPTQAGEDGQYEVEARVVDLSRREVRGAGGVRATRAAFDLFVRSDRGFYRPGEHASLEIAAQDANGKPVAVPVQVLFRRQTWNALGEKLAENAIAQQSLALPAEGRLETRFAPAEAGDYRVVVSATDARGEAVSAETTLRVASDDERSDLFRLSDVELTLERPAWRTGETARVLVASSRAGAVLLTEEAEGRILRHLTVRLDGRGRVVSIPLTPAHAPNVFLRATQVSDGRVYTAQRELFVPPDERFLNVEARPIAATVKPGQKAALELRVTDAAGRPVVGSFSVAVTDRAVEAIQAPFAPDIRAFFYGERRGLSVNEVSSFAFRAPLATRLDAKETAYRRHGQPPGWWGSLRAQRRDWVGEELELDAPAEEAAFAASEPQAQAADAVVGGVVGGRLAPASPPAARAAAKEARAEEALVEPQTRSVFADTAYWSAAVVTDAQGRATVEVAYPDSLTDWKIVARGLDAAARVGEATASVVARKDLMVRLQSPRFFVERDRALLSALVQNDLSHEVEATVRLRVSEVLRLEAPAEARVRIAPRSQARVEWRAEVVGSGEAKVHVAALTSVESDAAELRFDALVHGADKLVAEAGRIPAGEEREIFFDVPAERARGSARLTLTVAPSLVASLLDAIPYLVDYPYGCVEQTLSRFLPAVVLSKALADSGADLADLVRRRDALAVGDRGLKRNPVFDAAELRAMVRAGLQRIYGFQNPQGGFGWWKGDAGDVRMTAYVLYGLVTARAAGYEVDGGVLERAAAFLEGAAKTETSLHARAYAAFALASAGRIPADLDLLLRRRADLSVHGKSLLALALVRSRRAEDADRVVGNLADAAVVDAQAGTASWRTGTSYWLWEHDRVESQAFALWALSEARPASPLAPQVARWLLLNRQGSRWHSTRDTAHAIYALAAYAKQAGETEPDLTIEATLGGVARTFRVTAETALAFDDTLVIGDAELGAGRRKLSLRVRGRGAAYFSASLRYFTREEDIRGAGTSLRLRREYFRRLPRVVEEAGARRLVHDLEPLPSLAGVRSGDEVEVKLTIEAPTAYDHLVFEDPKPAGFEPVDLVSGSRYGDGLCSNMELRDERVAFFVTHLAQGRQAIRYVLRAETPGEYHALPARGYAMYAPEIAALADEWRGVVGSGAAGLASAERALERVEARP
jgi:hypothetical protein